MYQAIKLKSMENSIHFPFLYTEDTGECLQIVTKNRLIFNSNAKGVTIEAVAP